MILRATALLLSLAAGPCASDTLRIATFNTELSRDGPGLLLRDIQSGRDPQVAQVVEIIQTIAPDILVLQGIDWDHDNRALGALNTVLGNGEPAYPHHLALRPNTGLDSGLDLDGDGRLGEPEDSQGYGAFTGQSGMALLSRLPIELAAVRDLSPLLWRDLPGALLPQHADGSPFPSEQALAAQRLSHTGHWIVPLALPGGGQLTLMMFQAAPPVFDGPEDRNGRRNHDEIRLWQLVLDGALGPAPQPPLVIAGGANLDPDRGEGRRGILRALLSDPRLQDPAPESPEAGMHTVDWPGPGRMRVDYLLPSADLQVTAAAVHWPPSSDRASRHRLVWVDIDLDKIAR